MKKTTCFDYTYNVSNFENLNLFSNELLSPDPSKKHFQFINPNSAEQQKMITQNIINDSFESINNQENNNKILDPFENDFFAGFNKKQDSSMNLFQIDTKNQEDTNIKNNNLRTENLTFIPELEEKTGKIEENVTNFKKEKKFVVFSTITKSKSDTKVNSGKELKKKYKCEHPGCNARFRTLKLKIIRHDIKNCQCKLDTIYVLQMISEIKKIINKKNVKKNKTRYNRLKNLYIKCVNLIPHKDYFVNIVGKKF